MKALRKISLSSRGGRHQLGISIALISIIPLLACVYLLVAERGEGIRIWALYATVLTLAVCCVFLGYMIIGRYPVNIARLRVYLENMVSGRLQAKVRLLNGEEDVHAIERCLDIIVENLSEQIQRMRGDLAKIDALAQRGSTPAVWEDERVYGRAHQTELSRAPGPILSTAGADMLSRILCDLVDPVETCATIYERNGDVAVSVFMADWCRILHGASIRVPVNGSAGQRVGVVPPLVSVACAKAARDSMATGQPADLICGSGIRCCFVPIFADNQPLGAIGFIYGNPPHDEASLREMAQSMRVDADQLRRSVLAYEAHPQFLVHVARNRLLTSSRLIGQIVEREQAERTLRDSQAELQKHRAHLEELIAERTAELTNLNAQLQTEVEQRREAERLKDEFVSTVSHELRTPLAISKEGISLLLDKIPGAINPEQEKILATVDASMVRLIRIINDLLDIAKIEAGRMALRKRKTDLSELIAPTLAPMGGRGRAQGASFGDRSLGQPGGRERRSRPHRAGHHESGGQCRQVHGERQDPDIPGQGGRVRGVHGDRHGTGHQRNRSAETIPQVRPVAPHGRTRSQGHRFGSGDLETDRGTPSRNAVGPQPRRGREFLLLHPPALERGCRAAGRHRGENPCRQRLAGMFLALPGGFFH